MMRWVAVLLVGVGCTQADPCAAVECGRGVCVNNAGAPACLCERGFEEIDRRCFPVTLCGAQRPGEDGGCSGEPRWDCATKTGSTAQDPAEPNDCPPQARALAIDGSAIGAFGVEGDLDWYFVEGAPNTVVNLTVEGAPMSVAGFSTDGFTERAAFDFAEPFSIGTRGLFLAVRAQETGPYRLSLAAVGQDDRTDEFFDALEVPAQAFIEGTLDFPGDVDVVALRMLPGSSAQVTILGEARAMCDVSDAHGRLVHSFVPHASVWSESGLLFLSVRSGNNTPARWSLQITSVGLDDVPDHPDFAPRVGTPGEQRFERSNDLDVFRIEPRPGFVYEANCRGTASCSIVALDRGNQAITQPSAPLRFRAPAEGPVFLRFSAVVPGTWSWTLRELGPDDHGDELSTATLLAPGMALQGRLDFPDDFDAFTVDYPMGTLLQFDAGIGKVVQSGNRTILAGGLVVETTPTLLVVSGREGPYDIAVASLGLEPGGSESMPISVTLPFRTDAGIEYPYDQDVWVFPAIAGHVYRATVSPDQQLTVRQQNAFGSSSGQGSAQIIAAVNGQASVSVFGFEPGDYRLEIADIGVDDHPDDTSVPLVVGVPATGWFDSADDWEFFTATLVAGRFYEARCPNPDCLVSQGRGSQLRVGSYCVQPMAAQASFAVVSGSSSGDFVSSSWSLELVDLGDDDHLSSVLQASPVPFDSSTSGMLSCHADQDTFKWTAGPRQITALRASCTGCSVTVMSRWAQEATEVDGGLLLLVPPSPMPITASFEATFATAFTFTVSDGGFDDHGDTLLAATAAAPNATITGELQYEGDADVFFFDLAAGGHLFGLTGADVQAELWLSTGPLFTLNTNSMQFNATMAGRYYVLLRGRGPFGLTVQ